MVKLLSRLIFLFFSNIVAFLIANYFVPGFFISLDLKNLFAIAGIFTLINIFLRPIIKFILSPIIFLTFGLGTILVNAFLLWIVDLYSKNLTISSFKSLLFSTLIVSFINGLLHFSAKALNK